MAKFTFYQEYPATIMIRDTYEIEAESYKDAVRMIEEEGELFNLPSAERISSEQIDLDPEGRNACGPVSIFNEDDEEIL